MAITYSDQEIAELIQERKVLPDDWRNKLLSPKNKKQELFVTGDNGNEFRIIARQNNSRPLDFSVILTVLVPLSNRNFRLLRYNGSTNPHTNRIESEEVSGFHIHFATERYQQRGQKEEAYAEQTERYSDFDGALQCLIDDANFEEPPQLQAQLF